MCETCKIYVENFATLKSEYQRLQSEVESERRTNEQAKVEIDRLLGLLDERKDDVKQLDHERKMVVAQCEAMKENMDRLQKLYGERQVSGTRDSRNRQETDHYITGLQAELRKANAAVQDLTSEKGRLEVALNEARNSISTYKSEQNTLLERLKNTCQENDKLNSTVLQLQNDAVGLKTEVHNLKSTADDLRLEKDFVTEEVRVAAEAKLKNVERENRELRRQNDTLCTEKSDLLLKTASIESTVRVQLQREREDMQHQLGEMHKRFIDGQEQHKAEMKTHDQKVQAMQEEQNVIKAECGNLRATRTELQGKLSDLTAKCARVERREEHLRHELQECNVERNKLRGEVDRLVVRLTEAKKNEAKLALLDVKLQYKDQEVLEARQEKELAAAEGAKILTAVQQLNKKERQQLQKAKREQAKLVHVLKEYMGRTALLEEHNKKLQTDHEAYVKHAEIRLNAATVMAPLPHGAHPPQPAFIPDPELFKEITENLRKTAELEKRQHVGV
eukprot:TRINITY_DN2897_c0_g2_i4.p1 TRINITY_DN2897_c0_g2~~TRINITY_DN2897_c0_g2_i4.p1  ORF type:complete len:530 (+),score=151.27 TRINITY_DN2897_c0_g2_i4:77-1591(+)